MGASRVFCAPPADCEQTSGRGAPEGLGWAAGYRTNGDLPDGLPFLNSKCSVASHAIFHLPCSCSGLAMPMEHWGKCVLGSAFAKDKIPRLASGFHPHISHKTDLPPVHSRLLMSPPGTQSWDNSVI